MNGIFISFEGTEGSGKSTQVALLAERLRGLKRTVNVLREPGGTGIGEEIRHTLKHSDANHAMTPETELLLMNASRAQLVREVIRPALASGDIVICDRFFDSTTAYQGFGRQLDLRLVRSVIDFAVEDVRPSLTVLLEIPPALSTARILSRQARLMELASEPDDGKGNSKLFFAEPQRDRMEEADKSFFERVHRGFQAVAMAEPRRVRIVDATQSVEVVAEAVWKLVRPLL